MSRKVVLVALVMVFLIGSTMSARQRLLRGRIPSARWKYPLPYIRMSQSR